MVEDSDAIRLPIAAALSAQGFELAGAADGNDLEALLPSFAPDLVILDVMLPGRDGFELLRVIRRTSTAAVLMLTAKDALAKATDTDQRLTKLWANRDKRTLTETVVVQFDFDKWLLNDGAQTRLLELVKQLQDQPQLSIELEGYTDSTGPGPYNIQLSQRRAETVRRFLVDKGVELPRIHSIGLGDIRPVADNKSPEGRANNRRVKPDRPS